MEPPWTGVPFLDAARTLGARLEHPDSAEAAYVTGVEVVGRFLFVRANGARIVLEVKEVSRE